METITDKMNCLDPIRIKNECELYNQAMKKLDYGIVRQPLRNQLIAANGKLNESMQNYFEHRIIINSVLNFLNSERTTKSNEFVRQTHKEKDVSADPLYLNLIKKYIVPDSSTDVNLFAINDEFITKTLEIRPKSQLEKDKLNKYVEKSIHDMCQKLIGYSGYAYRNKKDFRRTFKNCIADLVCEADKIFVIEREISSNKIEIDDLLLTYYEELKKGLSMMKRLFCLLEKKVNFEVSINALYAERCCTLSWKIKLFELEVLKATYTRKTNLALKIISEQLDSQDVKLKELLTVTNADIQVYSALGEEYEALVKEYTDISNKIQEQQWALDSLKEKYSHSERK